MNHIDRLREQDLCPFVANIVKAMLSATQPVVTAACRPERDYHLALHIACAIAARASREVAGLPIDVWDEAEAIALDKSSLTNQFLLKNG